MQIIQYLLVIITVLAALGWLLRKQLFPSRHDNSNCGDGDCGCH
ncbi:FeoB-associated Cys-rich membrane protein [Nonlabens ponticola]|uniref:FeoB-associated Cys-rich membrane protein n=1 Tax=Nonlabens ponticola TaxID=2496866 RepID=A0A3S9MW18_9FLAO|nr:FeoB-associated Cys-rich membrane protein [Nonlabens ponticola]AZQ43329.1 FeoB-associated Cys-rich membrane protein [Nonlabens ponticola]